MQKSIFIQGRDSRPRSFVLFTAGLRYYNFMVNSQSPILNMLQENMNSLVGEVVSLISRPRVALYTDLSINHCPLSVRAYQWIGRVKPQDRHFHVVVPRCVDSWKHPLHCSRSNKLGGHGE